jgi:hypothetical protein
MNGRVLACGSRLLSRKRIDPAFRHFGYSRSAITNIRDWQ